MQAGRQRTRGGALCRRPRGGLLQAAEQKWCQPTGPGLPNAEVPKVMNENCISLETSSSPGRQHHIARAQRHDADLHCRCGALFNPAGPTQRQSLSMWNLEQQQQSAGRCPGQVWCVASKF